MKVKIIPVENSQIIVGRGYRKSDETMFIVYHKTGMYEYYEITPEEYDRVIISDTVPTESIGRTVREIVKGKRFSRVQ